MRLTHEIKTCVQYVVIAMIAGILAFITSFPDAGEEGEIAIAVNISEAWMNYAPVLRVWLLAFLFLSIIRFMIFFIVNERKYPK